MNKYTKLSDFEINKAVFHKAKIKHKYFRFLPNGVITYNIKGKYQVFDPCNNIEQAWEIMMKYNIEVVKNHSCDSWIAISENGEHEHKKPLVAAMLCFLEM